MIDIHFLGHRYISPINPSAYPQLSLVLLFIGVFFTAWFFVYEVTTTKLTRQIRKEIRLSLASSVFMGLGTMFLILSTGVYM